MSDIYQQAIDTFGEEHQMNKAVEEAGEFIAADARLRNAVSTKLRYELTDKLNGEAADLYIMMQQWRLMIGAHNFDALVATRLARLEQLISDAGDK